MSSRRARAGALVALALIVGACNAEVPPQPTPSVAVSESPRVAVSESPRVAETMIVGVRLPADQALGGTGGVAPIDLPLHSLHPNGSAWDAVVTRFVYSGVYRLDDAQSPVPDLAAEPCAISADLLLVTCRLREASFHDGTPLKADDVAFTYQLGLSKACRQLLCVNSDEGRLAEATALDARTVEFRLTGPDPAFITSVLPSVLIEPRARVERAFAEFVETSRGADPASLRAIASRLASDLRPGDTCAVPSAAVLVDAERAVTDIGRKLRPRSAYAISPDACAYGDYLVRVLTDAADALGQTGIDAIAAAYRILEPAAMPVGSGPWRVLSIDPGVSMQLEAFDAFYRGIAATARLEVRLIRSSPEAIDAVRNGAIHWLLEPYATGEKLIAEGIGDAPGLVWEEYNRLSFTALHYNLRKGRLFADANLRKAVELCVDKDETVAAATGDEGVAIYSPITPSSWAYLTDLPRPTRDIRAGQKLIEASGWTLGADGIYRKGKQRLTTIVPVYEGRPQFVRFLQLLAFQVADCGIEIVPKPMSIDDLFASLDWPLVPPGADQPWDAVFSGWALSTDPDPLPLFHSSEIATARLPKGNNYMGYKNPESDRLLERARATYDPKARAILYRQHQRVLAEDPPMLFAWSPRLREARSDRLESTLGPLPKGTSTWWWQLETLFLRSPNT